MESKNSTITITMYAYDHLMPSIYNSSIDELDNVFTNQTKVKIV